MSKMWDLHSTVLHARWWWWWCIFRWHQKNFLCPSMMPRSESVMYKLSDTIQGIRHEKMSSLMFWFVYVSFCLLMISLDSYSYTQVREDDVNYVPIDSAYCLKIFSISVFWWNLFIYGTLKMELGHFKIPYPAWYAQRKTIEANRGCTNYGVCWSQRRPGRA